MEKSGQNHGSQYIGDIAKSLGISTRSIRYYEELDLIIPKRSDGGFREYSNSEVEKLKSIIKLKKLGMSLEEIQHLVKMTVGNKKGAPELLNFLKKRLEHFEEKINEYKNGVKEIEELIKIVENCHCNSTNVIKCEACLKEQDKKMPEIMKAIL